MKLVNITGRVLNPDLTPVPHAIGKAVLTSYEVDGGVIVPSVVDITADENGHFAVELWPNGRGSGGSQYIVKLYNGLVTVFNARIFVPDVDVSVDLSTIVISSPYPPVNQSLRVLLENQESQVLIDAAKRDVFNALESSERAQIAALQSKTEATSSAQAAAGSAQAAATSAGESAQKASQADESASQALVLKTQSADSSSAAAAMAQQAFDSAVQARASKEAAAGLLNDASAGMVVLVKDSLRASVEAASGGRMTVLYTANNNPSYVHILPSFRCDDIAPGGELGSGLHPAFVVNGVGKSEIFVGAYQASMIGAEAVSLPGVAPRAAINFDNAKAACMAAGPGWHMITNWEWAAIALWCMANGFEPRGNTQYGRHHVNRIETGRKVNGGIPGDTSTSRPNLTGSGPATWAHDGTTAGIHDLVGNVWEWQDGMRLQDGQVCMPNDNNILMPESEWPAHDLWFSGSSETASSTLKLVTDEADVIRNGEISSDVNSGFNDSQTWGNLAITGEAPLLMRQALIAPSALKPTGRVYARTYGARFPLRGGVWYYGANAGVAALDFSISRVGASSHYGFRVAFAL